MNIKEKIFSGNKRTAMTRKNMLQSSVLKVVSLLCSLVIVPITLDYLNDEVYGIWMVISSVLFWINFFDIGLGNGMRNYLAEAVAVGNFDKAKTLVSTTFSLLTMVALPIAIIGTVLVCVLDLNYLFNTSAVESAELRDAMLVAVLFTTAHFVAKNIGMVYVAFQRYAINDLLNVSSNIVSVLTILVLKMTTEGCLMNVVAAFTIPHLVIFITAALPLFKQYPQIRPSLSHIDMQLGRSIVKTGVGFFAIQITSCLVIFGSANILITHFHGPKSVTIYNIAYKYFNLLVIAYTIYLSPLWSAYTDAKAKGDRAWIGSTFSKSLKMWGMSAVAGIIMLACSGLFYNVWIKDKVEVPLGMSAAVLFYLSMFNLNNCVTYLINGLNTIRVQITTSLAASAIYIVIMLVGHKALSAIAIVIIAGMAYLAMALVHIVQCRMLIKGTARGVWNK